MTKGRIVAAVAAALVGSGMTATPARAQMGQITGIKQRGGQILTTGKKVVNDWKFTEAEERQLGADVSAKLREKYGVVQNAAVHRYVTLVGSVLARRSERPTLRWTFIVLDTDGVNAFAAPGGFVHITRGALSLLKSEAELAGVLGHEIGHITAKHTLTAVQINKTAGAITSATRLEFLNQVADRVYAATLENTFSRGDESEADEAGIVVANKAGYTPTGLGGFLTTLSDRNKGLKERSGMFASHPEIKDRLEDMAEIIEDEALKSTATVAPRYRTSIAYRPVPIEDIPQVAPPSRQTAKAEEPKSGGKGFLGLGGRNPLAREKSSSSTIASTGSRGVNPDRDAKGGPNKSVVVVNVSTAEINAFAKGIVA